MEINLVTWLAKFKKFSQTFEVQISHIKKKKKNYENNDVILIFVFCDDVIIS